MKQFSLLILVAVVLIGAPWPRNASAQQKAGDTTSSSLRFDPHRVGLSDGSTVDAEIARLAVPERRAAPGSRTIELALIRLRSTSPRPGTPILYLNGSPGGAAASALLAFAPFHPFFSALRQAADVIVLDYRGSGLSTPRLACPRPDSIPPDLFASRENARNGFLAQGAVCARDLRAKGIDLTGYTWNEVADDVADIRRALGVPKLDIVGFSSGTHATLATLRNHADDVGRVVLIGTEGLDHARKIPTEGDRQLRAIDRLIAGDPAMRAQIPDFPALVDSVLRQLDREPAIVEVRRPGIATPLRGKVGRFALSYITAKNLSGPDEFDLLPRLYHSISRGDLSVLTRVMQRFVERPPPSPLAYVLDGASGSSPARQRTIAGEAKRSVLGDAVNFPFPEIRAAWDYEDLGEPFRTPFRTTVPAFFVTGELDGNTPPHQAEEVRKSFPASSHLVLGNGGHDAALRSPDAMKAIVAFLRGEDVRGATITLPPVRLSPLRR